eukprot:g993.t1
MEDMQMADLDKDESARDTFQTLFDAADDDHSNRISYEELVEAATVSDEWGHNLCREEATMMADEMFARARELFPDRDIKDEDGLTFVEFVRATGASIKETTENADGLHDDVVEAQNARLNNTLRTVASKNTIERKASVTRYLRDEVLAEMGPENEDDQEMARRRSEILKHISDSNINAEDTGSGDIISAEAVSIIQSHAAEKVNELEDLIFQKDQKIISLEDKLEGKFSQIDSLKRQRREMAETVDRYQDRIQELEKLLKNQNDTILSDTQRELEHLKEATQWAVEKQKQQLEELRRQTLEAEKQRKAAAAEASAISKRMAVQHVFSRAASKSVSLKREIEHKKESLRQQTDKVEIDRLHAELEEHERELLETQSKLESLKADRAKLVEMQDLQANLARENDSVKKQLSEVETLHKQEHEDLLVMQRMHAKDAEELERLKSRLEEVDRLGKEKEAELLKKAADRKALDIEGWSARIADAEQRKAELKTEVERLKIEDAETINRLKTEKIEQEKRNASLHQENVKREEALKVLQEQMKQEHEECLRLKREGHEHAEAQAKTVNELQNAYDILHKEHLAKNEELEMSRAREQGLIEQLQQELAESKKKLAEAERQKEQERAWCDAGACTLQ